MQAQTTTRQLNLLILSVAGRLMQAAELILDDTSLTPARSRALGCLLRAKDRRLTVSELSGELVQSRQGTALLVQRMAADGLVQIEDNPRHRKAFLVRATPAGATLYRTGNARQESFNAALDARMPAADIAALVTALTDYSELFDLTLATEFGLDADCLRRR